MLVAVSVSVAGYVFATQNLTPLNQLTRAIDQVVTDEFESNMFSIQSIMYAENKRYEFIKASISFNPGGTNIYLYRPKGNERFNLLYKSQEAPLCKYVIEYAIPTNFFGETIDGCYREEGGSSEYVLFSELQTDVRVIE